MAKKNDNTILYIAVAGVAALLLLRKKTTPVAVTPVTSIAPVSASSANSGGTGILSDITNSGIIKSIADLFKGDPVADSPSSTSTDYTAGNSSSPNPYDNGVSGDEGFSAWYLQQNPGSDDYQSIY